MELILINDTKLKIMLTREDMVRYELDCDSADYDNTETRRAFWSILDEAKHRTGFDAAHDRVFIQLYPSREGGCEMFVTKVGLIKEERPATRSARRAAGRAAAAAVAHPPAELAFSFCCLDALLECCRLLSEWSPLSSAYAGEGGEWYLFLSSTDDGAIRSMRCVLGELGSEVDPEQLKLYISEHGQSIIAEGAISQLAVL